MSRPIERVLVRAPNWVGDLVMATPAFARVRSRFMDAEVVIGIKPSLQGVLAGTKSCDRFLPFGKVRGLGGLWRQAQALRRERFDLAILFTHSFSSLVPMFLAGIPERVGYFQNGSRLLLTRGLPVEKERLTRRWGPRRKPKPMVEHYFALLDLLGCPRAFTRPILRVTPAEEAAARALGARYGLVPGAPYVLINPGASFGASKLWPAERFAAMAVALRARIAARDGGPVPIVCLAGPGEEALARAIAAAAPGVIAAVDPLVPLDVLKPVVRDAALLITNDTGPRHYAVAFEVPVVVLMGPTDPRFTHNDLERTVVLRHEVPCGPCHLKACPLDHACMTLITVDEVVATVLDTLRRFAPAVVVRELAA